MKRFKRILYVLTISVIVTLLLKNSSLKEKNLLWEKRYENLLNETHRLSLSTDELMKRLKSLDSSGHIFLKESDHDSLIYQLYKKENGDLSQETKNQLESTLDLQEQKAAPFLTEIIQDISGMEKKLKQSESRMKWISYVVNSVPSMFPTFGYINSYFGERLSPVTGHKQMHKGVDIAAPIGTKVFATADGVVGYSGHRGNYGKLISINHGLNFMTRYAHLSKRHVKKGDKVKRGDVIGTVGKTGRTTGAHLHYEVRLNNLHVNPIDFLPRNKMYHQPESLFASVGHVGLPMEPSQISRPSTINLYSHKDINIGNLWLKLSVFLLLFFIFFYFIVYFQKLKSLYLKRMNQSKPRDLQKYKTKFKSPVKFW